MNRRINKSWYAFIFQDDPRCNGQFGNVADETDCHKYFRCGTGVIEMTCGSSLAYNRVLDICDYEANVPECGIPTEPPTTAAPTTPSPPQPTTAPITAPITTPTCVEVTPDPSGACPALPPIIPDANGTTICGNTQTRKRRDITGHDYMRI